MPEVRPSQSPALKFLLEGFGRELPVPGAQTVRGGSPALEFLLKSVGDVRPAPPPIPLPQPLSILGEFGAGVEAGARGLVPLGAGLAGVTAQVFGAEETARELLEFASETQEAIFRDLPPTVTFDEAFSSPKNLARFAVRVLGEQVPVVASIILGGGVGGLIGRLVGRGALSVAEGTAGLSRFGVTAGAITTATGIETGATAGELFQATREVRPAASFAAGIAKGALEAVVPLALATRFGLGPGVAEGIISRSISFLDKISGRGRRIAAGFGAAAIAESTTEFLQEAVDVGVRSYVDENFDALSSETRNRLLESATIGAIVGAVFGGIGGAVGGRGPGRETALTALPPGGAEVGVVAAPVEVPPTGIMPPAPVLPEVPPAELPPAVPREVPPAEVPPPVVAEVPPAPPGINVALGDDVVTITPEVATRLAEVAAEQRDEPEQAMLAVQRANGGGVLNPVVEHAGDIFHRMAKDLPFGVLPVDDVLSKIDTVLSGLTSRFGFAREHTQNLRNNARERGVPIEEQQAAVNSALARLARANNRLVPLNRPQRLAKEIAVAVAETRFDDAVTAAQELRTLITESPAQFLQEVTSISAEGAQAVTPTDVRRAIREIRIPTANPPGFRVIARKVFPPGVSVSIDDAVRRLDALVKTRPDFTEFRQDVKESEPGTQTELKQNIVARLAELLSLPKEQAQRAPALVSLITSLGLVVKTTDPKLASMQAFRPRRSDEETDTFMAANKNISGTAYNPDKHRLGTAMIASESGAAYRKLSEIGKKNARAVRDAMTEMLKLFGMKNEKLVIAVDAVRAAEGTTDFLRAQDHGAALTPSPNRSYILVNSRILEKADPLELAALIAHEFGHILTWRNFVNTDPAVQLKIINAFNRRTQKAAAGSMFDFATVLRSPGAFDFLSILAKGDAPALSTPALNQNPQYWFNFSEFLAEQVAKWITTRRQPLTLVEGFLRGTARSLRRLYQELAERFGLDSKVFRADTDVEAWIESLVGGKEIGAPEALRDNVEGRLGESAQTNVILMGDANSTPSAEMGLNIERMAVLSGVPRRQAKKARAGVDRINWLLKWGLSLRQLTQLNPQIAGLRIYNELMDAWNNAATQWKSRADTTLKEWRALSRQSQEDLAKFIFEIDAMVYLEKGEKPRQPTQAELLSLAKKHKLTNEAFIVFRQVRTDLNDFLTAIQEVLEDDIRATVENELIQDVKIAQVQKEFNRLRERPYFPHSRFGDFTVVVKDSDGKTAYMEQFATRQEARNTLKTIVKLFKAEEGFIARVDKIPEEARPFRGLPPALLQQLKGLPGLTAQQRIWIEQLVVELSPAQSFRKRLARRKDVPGFSLDAMRSYASYFWHGSNYLARIQFQRPLQEAVNSVHAEASDPQFALTQPGQDVSQRRRIADFMQQHMDQILNPAPDWAQVRSIAFIWWLGFAPQSAILNLTQVPMVALPYLSARYGGLKSTNALRKALGAVPRMMRRKTEDVSDGFLTALSRAVENGVVDESYATELAATSEGPNLTGLLPGNKPQRGMMKIAHWSAFMFQMSEKFNRRATFTAAWELAMADPTNPILQELKELNTLEHRDLVRKGFNEGEALAYLAARDAVWATQFQYSNHARARFMRGRKGVIFTFFTFVQNMVFFAAHDRGRIQFFLMMFVLAGMMGLPFAEDINAVARFAARKLLGQDFDIEKATREFVVDVMGEDSISPDLILHGISRVGFGIPAAADILGIPFPKFDLSASVGLGRIIPGVQELGPPSRSFDAMFSRISTDVAGASFGIGINILKFLSDDELPFGDHKRWERALPRAMKNLIKANRFLEEGRERTRTGATVLEFDASDPDQLAEIIGQAAGFTPTRLSRKWDRQRMEQEAIAFWTIRRGMLLKQMDHATTVGDKGAVADVIAAIRRYNNEVAIAGFKISSRELRQSQRERARRRRLFEVGIPAQRRAIGLVRDIQRLFPEVEDVEDVTRMR